MTGISMARIVEPNKVDCIDVQLAAHYQYYYQPQFSLRTNKLKGFECLLRLNHPATGVVGPGRFIERLNPNSVWKRLWPVMLSKIAFEQKRIRETLRLSINLSPDDLQEQGSAFLSCFYDMAINGEINPSFIEFEITEDKKIEDYEQVNSSIHILKKLGAKVVVDDFGSGFCNMKAIDKLSVDGIKIDRSLITGIETSEVKQTIVRSLVEIAKVKGCFILAEGIETKPQLELSEKLGCDYGQGFLLGRPGPSFVHKAKF